MMGRLAGKTAIITGACSGIGFGIAEAYVDEGARVAIFDVETDDFESVNAQLDGETLTVECDVMDSNDVQSAVDRVLDEWGQIDIVVNNAGIVVRNNIENTTDEEMELVLDVDLKGVMRVTRAAMPALRESGGSIINISSAAAEGGVANLSAYSAAKGGVSSLTRQLAADYGEDGVNVNAIAPGTAKTPINEAVREKDPEWEAEIASKIPLGRLATPQDMQGPAVFLASEEGAYVSGQILLVDGGRTAQSR
ncbi:SDR family NAD(P)-dependent oxidoreductase [Halomarina salina]|uniref:SDR family NAD(P)-dependent oxidoreductase n=1 Tax=Halomarina salina TaxID=1872699 RepID=A0ABD5RV14_9EURY|nr:SDR family oxidoreductase [Halomarina salina]